MQEFVLLGIVLVLGLGAYWSLVIFPRQRDFQKQQKYVNTLNVGDEMITFGGIIGRVMTVEPEKGIATIEIADGVLMGAYPDIRAGMAHWDGSLDGMRILFRP